VPIDWGKVDEVTLALLNATSFEEHGVVRFWKGHDWDVMNRLHTKGWVHDPVGRARAVVLTEQGVEQSGALFTKHLAIDENAKSPRPWRGTFVHDPGRWFMSPDVHP